MNPIQREWGLEHILEANEKSIVTKLEMNPSTHAERIYKDVKEGTLEVAKGGIVITARGTKQTWETFKMLYPGEVYPIYADSRYRLGALGATEVIETKVPDLKNLIQKIKDEKYET